MIKDLTDKEIVDLLDDAFKKIASTSEQDSKKLSDMNNTLNWILTLTTVFFVFYSRQEKLPDCLQMSYKLLFVASILLLVLHKIFLIKYEDYKGGYLASLRTHQIDLKHDISKIKVSLVKLVPFHTVDFINAFRNGDFFYVAKEQSKKELAKLDSRIRFCGHSLVWTFWIGIVAFFLNMILITIILFN